MKSNQAASTSLDIQIDSHCFPKRSLFWNQLLKGKISYCKKTIQKHSFQKFHNTMENCWGVHLYWKIRCCKHRRVRPLFSLIKKTIFLLWLWKLGLIKAMKFTKRILESTTNYPKSKAPFRARMSWRSNLTTICKWRKSYRHTNASLDYLKRRPPLHLAKTNLLLKIQTAPNPLNFIKIQMQFNKALLQIKNWVISYTSKRSKTPLKKFESLSLIWTIYRINLKWLNYKKIIIKFDFI